ncbi:MAG: 16S rRNA (guanine(527)-N(7))-methyltransferase RsmG [Acidobacteria bacterium]|nr:16S rRNA (guanine(527)-N(7))-methyltransferase RsmG [Acidobacteriota bacterium]
MSSLSDLHPWFIKNRIPIPKSRQEVKLEKFLGLLLNWNRKMNLTADNNRHILLTRHLLDSMMPLAGIEFNEISVVDVGSGTGFPAIPLAIMLPETPFVLVEKVARKCAFLKMAARRLHLSNVQVMETLIQDWHPESRSFRTAITRAVRVDDELKAQLIEKGAECLLYFSSQSTSDTILEYRLPEEGRTRYLDLISLAPVAP